MEYNEAIKRAKQILKLAKHPEPEKGLGAHFGPYAEEVAYAARQLKGRKPRWFKDWALAWRKLYDDYERIRVRDPMIIYQPRNPTSYSFHSSTAFVRYFRAGNRTSKTQSGYAEHYFNVTGHHPFRPMPDTQASTLIVSGLPFTDYTPKVFEKKMIVGEDNNILSPMFPEGGKWLYKYDPRKHIILLACKECAEKGKAGSCPSHHKKVTIGLVSSEKGVGVIEAFAVRLAHGDEHIPEEFYTAMQMRLADSPGGNLIFTGTPLHGPEAWEVEQLARLAEGPDNANRVDTEDPDSPKLVSMHHCSMWDGNVARLEAIKAYSQTLDEFQCRARIEGIPAPLASNPVFDRAKLEEMEKDCCRPKLGVLSLDIPLVEADDTTPVEFTDNKVGDLRVWEEPQETCQYIIAVDTAAGLAKRDPSCAHVLKLAFRENKIVFEQVAEYHGWIPVHEYADEAFKLALWYNSALIVVELTGGLGRAVIERLKKELYYWNIFRDTSKGEWAQFHQDSRFGVDTSAHNKASMVSVLQQVIQDGRLVLRDKETIQELVAFEQERTDFGNSRYRGAGGTHDDRVMALVIGISTAVSHALYSMSEELGRHDRTAKAQVRSGEWKEIHRELRARENAGEEWL